MKKHNARKGFTIVELVITIAVIGVLTAILVPTFIGLTRKANERSDDSLVANLNKALAIHEGERGDTHNDTYQDAINDLWDEGYRTDVLVTKSGKTLLWYSVDNRFYLDDEGTIAGKPTGAKDVDFWCIYSDVPETPKYSIYAGAAWNGSKNVTVSVGFDAGEHDDFDVAYQSSTTQEALVRTNGGTFTVNAPAGTVKHFGEAEFVNIVAVANQSYHENGIVPFIQISKGRIEIEPSGDVNGIHIANIQTVDDQGNISKTPNEFTGDVALALNGNDVKLSRDTIGTHIENAVLVCEVTASASSASEFIWLVGDGTIENAKVYVTNTEAAPDTTQASTTTTANASEAAKAIANNAVNTGTEDAPVYAPEESGVSTDDAQDASSFKGYGTSTQPYQIGYVNELILLSKKVSAGETFEGKYFVLTKDLDMKNVLWGVATDVETIDCIGTKAHPFKGNFDGGHHTIKNLSNGDRVTTETYTNPTSGTVGNIFGLFGYVGGNVTIKDLKINVDADIPYGKCCAAVIASVNAGATVNLSEITVSGNIYARDEKAAGLIGVTNAGSTTVTVTKCVNEVNIIGRARVAGFISQTGSGDVIDFVNCQNKGTISLTKVNNDYEIGKYGVAAGFISHSNGATVNYDSDCANLGTINAPLAADFQTYVSSNIVYDGNNQWRHIDNNSITTKNLAWNVGIIRSAGSENYAKLAENEMKILHGYDGSQWYDSGTEYVIEASTRRTLDGSSMIPRIFAKYTLEEWNSAIDGLDGIRGDTSASLTVRLLADMEWTYLYQTGTSVPTVTVDLNGHTLTATSSILKGTNSANNNFVFKNGTINAAGVKLVESNYLSVTFENVTGSWANND